MSRPMPIAWSAACTATWTCSDDRIRNSPQRAQKTQRHSKSLLVASAFSAFSAVNSFLFPPIALVQVGLLVLVAQRGDHFGQPAIKMLGLARRTARRQIGAEQRH